MAFVVTDHVVAALAVAVGQDKNLHEAARFATAAGSLACTKLGAQAAMPTDVETKMLMDDQPRQ